MKLTNKELWQTIFHKTIEKLNHYKSSELMERKMTTVNAIIV